VKQSLKKNKEGIQKGRQTLSPTDVSNSKASNALSSVLEEFEGSVRIRMDIFSNILK
jgi:hypothetical protein